MDSIVEQPRAGQPGRPSPGALPTTLEAAGPDLPLAIAAWIWAEPATAAALMEAWLATADAEGNLSPPCPVICQLAERVADALPQPEKWLARILPGLARGVEREFDRYDARGTGLPLWPSAEEALFPAEFAPERFTVDLAVLLSNEASAFRRLAEGHTELDRALGAAEGEQRELDAWLVDNFWDEETAAFHRLDAGAASVPDFSPCGFWPLAWEGRTEPMVEGVRPRLSESDAGAWSARGWVLFFALVLRTPHHGVVAWMRRKGLPAGAAPVAAAAWTVLVAGSQVLRTDSGAEIPAAARWLDERGRGVALAMLAGVAVLGLGLLGWWIVHRDAPGAGEAADLERRARQACEDGNHGRAAALYGQAARRGPDGYARYRQAGEWMHLEQFADAEAAYRALLARNPDIPNARLNLALAVLQQGRREEARELYRAFAEAPEAAAFPELAERARLAAELVERQLALDREESPASTLNPEP